jgi:hypothetical protein
MRSCLTGLDRFRPGDDRDGTAVALTGFTEPDWL